MSCELKLLAACKSLVARRALSLLLALIFAQKDLGGLFAVKRDPDAQPRKRKAASAAEQPPRSSMIARKAAHKKNKEVEVAAATRATLQALGSASATRARVTLYRVTETTRCVAC